MNDDPHAGARWCCAISGAKAALQRYPGMGHAINDKQVRSVRELMERVAGR